MKNICILLKIALISVIPFASAYAAPVITHQPEDVTVQEYKDFDVAVVGNSSFGGEFSAKLFINGDEYSGSHELSRDGDGVFAANFTVDMLADLDGAEYYIVVTDSGGSAQTDTATISLALPELVVERPDSYPIAVGDNFSLSALIRESNFEPTVSAYDFVWDIGTQAFIPNSDNNPLSINNAQKANSGLYKLSYSLKGDPNGREIVNFILVSDLWSKNRATYMLRGNSSEQIPSMYISPNLGPFYFQILEAHLENPWIYIFDQNGNDNGLGWIATPATDPQNFWFFDPTLGWCWTKLSTEEDPEPLWPAFYNVDRGTWLYYVNGTTPRSFYDFNAGDFITVPKG